MGTLQMVKMLTAHFQFMGLLQKLEVPFPSAFVEYLSITNVLNLNFDVLFDLVNIPRIDQRVMFIFIAIGVPLALMILTALVFFSIMTILEITSALVGILVVLAFILRTAAPDWIPDDIENKVDTYEFLGLGLVILAGPIFARLSKRLFWKLNGHLRWMGHFIKLTSVAGGMCLGGFGLLVQKIAIAIVALFLCFHVHKSALTRQVKGICYIVLIGATVGMFMRLDWDVTTPPQFLIPAMVIVALGYASCMDFAINANTSSNGRFKLLRLRFQKFMDASLLTLALFGLQAAFVPVITFCMDMFLCTEYTCPRGFKFNPWAPRPADDFTTAEDLFCDACDFQHGCAFEPDRLCPPYRSRRLLKHPTVGCDESGFILFVVSAGLVLFVFCFVLILMYRKVITICCTAISKEVRGPTTKNKDPLAVDDEDKNFTLKSTVDPTKEYTLDLEWGNLMEKVDPKASSLYQPYRFQFRYFLLFETFLKVIMVVSSVIVAPYYTEAAFPLLLANFASLAVNAGLHPLIDELEHKLSIVLSFASTLTTAYAICVWQHPSIFNADGFAIGMIILGGIIPLIVAVVLGVVAVKNKFVKRKETGADELEKLEEQLEMKLLEEEDDSEEEKQSAPTAAGIMLAGESESLDSDELLLLGPSKPLVQVAPDPAPKPRPKRQRRQTIAKAPKRELTDEEKSQLEKLKKKKEMTPEERMMDTLNTSTKSEILKYFVWFAAPILIVSLVLTLFATLTGDTPEFVDASNVLDRSRRAVLNDYMSWDSFAEQCCCLVTKHPDPQFQLTERWVCRSDTSVPANASVGGRTIDRGRISKHGDTGLPIRGTCEKAIDPACEIRLADGNATVMMFCNTTFVRDSNLTDMAVAVLW